MSNAVAEQSRAVLALEEKRRLPRALMGGTAAMREKGDCYLPQEKAESAEAYQARLKRSFLFNGYAKTVEDMAGKVLAVPIALGEDVPPALAEMMENVDLAGRNLQQFADAVFKDSFEGVSYILVDMEAAPAIEGRVPTQAETRGRRPYAVHVKAEQVLGWRSEVRGGVEVLTQFRFMEKVEEPKGRFASDCVKQVRVFEREGDAVTWETWRQDAKSQTWVLHEQGPVTIGEIAIAPVYTGRTGFMAGEPPLLNLAEVNLAHWQSQSDQRNILHVARVPILFGAGIPADDPIVIGAGRMFRSSDPSAKLTYVEHTGAAIGAGRQDLQDLEHQMEVLGLELLTPRQGGESATGARIDEARGNTPLAMMAHSLQDGLEAMLRFMALFSGQAASGAKGGGSVTVNDDFDTVLDSAQDGNLLLGAVREKAITRKTFVRELQRRKTLADDITPEDEVADALAEGLDLMEDEPDAFGAPPSDDDPDAQADA